MIDLGLFRLTHYWQDERFPGCYTVTKVGCNDLEKLVTWGKNTAFFQAGSITMKCTHILICLESGKNIF